MYILFLKQFVLFISRVMQSLNNFPRGESLKRKYTRAKESSYAKSRDFVGFILTGLVLSAFQSRSISRSAKRMLLYNMPSLKRIIRLRISRPFHHADRLSLVHSSTYVVIPEVVMDNVVRNPEHLMIIYDKFSLENIIV